jgi:hypothetical protein
MSDTQTHLVYKMLDNLTDTMSWSELAKELNKYADEGSAAASPGSGDTIEMKDLIKSLREKNPPIDESTPDDNN